MSDVNFLEKLLDGAEVGCKRWRVNIAKGEYDVSDNTLIFQIKENVILKYLYYYLVNINLNRFTKGAGQPFSNDNLKLTTCDNRILTTLSDERKAG